jgi:hypothetical protein
MLTSLHGLLVEKPALHVYRQGARQLKAQFVKWEEIEILSEPEGLRRLVHALDLLRSNAVSFSEAVRTNLRAIICATGVMTRTLPVTRTFLIDSSQAASLDQKAIASMLVQSAGYCSFYTGKTIFVPTLFFRGRDTQAKSEARNFALKFQSEIDDEKPVAGS